MRPSDWTALDCSSDPVPGDATVVAAGGRDYEDVAEAIRGAQQRLRSIDLGDTISEAVDELEKNAQKVADSIGKAYARYRATGEALAAYAPHLDSAQRASIDALTLARSAVEAADTAGAQQRRYLRLAGDETDPAQTLVYTNLADTQGRAAGDAALHLRQARERLDGAIGERDRAAQAAIAHIQKITEHDGLHDSWWDDWGKNLLSVITDVAGWVSTIAGVLALVVSWIPVVGQLAAAALLLVAGIAAVINAIGNIVLASTGDRSWAEAGLSIAGAVLSVVGMGAAAKGVGLFLKGGTFAGRFGEGAATAAAKYSRTFGEQISARQAMKISKDDWAKWWSDIHTPLPEPAAGQTVYRTYGGEAKRLGDSWSPVDPHTLAHPRMELGLPDVNSMDKVVIAELRDPAAVVGVRNALPYNGNLGGAPEYFIKDANNAVNNGLLTVIEDVPFVVR